MGVGPVRLTYCRRPLTRSNPLLGDTCECGCPMLAHSSRGCGPCHAHAAADALTPSGEVTDEPGVGAVVRDVHGVEWERRAFPRSHPWFADDVPDDPSHVTWHYLSRGPLTLVRPAAEPEPEAAREWQPQEGERVRCYGTYNPSQPEVTFEGGFEAVFERRIVTGAWVNHDNYGRLVARRVEPVTPPPSDDTEAVERAAQAIYASDRAGDVPCVAWGDAAEETRDLFRANARALHAAGLLRVPGVVEVGAGKVVVEREAVQRVLNGDGTAAQWLDARNRLRDALDRSAS